jgi:peroxiredoxin
VTPRPGDAVPDFTLPATDGAQVALADAAAATVVVFTCNHCPYALAWHDRIQAVARDYAGRAVRVLQICSNDPDRYPRDAPEAMGARVEAGEFAGPYLHDASQEVARGYGATVTPDVFVLDGDLRLAYRGAPDADYRDESLAAGWLRSALDAVLAGEPVARPETDPVGCSIKWRP